MTSIKAKSVSAAVWHFLGMLSTHGIRFAVSIFLARLLTPEDFGIVGMAMVFISVSNVFIEAGFSTALIQKQDCNQQTYSTVFYTNIILGILLFCLFQLLAEQIANFYEVKEIEKIIRYLAIGIPLSALNIVQSTILTKELRFKELSIRSIVSGVLSGIVGVYLAYTGYGVYALVYQSIVMHLISTILLWRITDWRPSLEFSLLELKNISNFGGYIFLANILNQIFLKIDTILIGKFFSPSTLGFYTRAESLNNLVVKYSSSTLKKVLFPVLSTIEDDEKRFNKSFVQALNFSGFASLLIGGCLYFISEPIIIILFGEKWQESVLIFQILALKVYSYPINSVIVSAILASGLAKEHFWYANVRNVMRIVVPIVGYFYGFDAFLYGIVIVSFFITIFNFIIISNLRKISFFKLSGEFFKSFITVGIIIFSLEKFNNISFEYLYVIDFFNSLIFALIFSSLSYYFAPTIKNILSLIRSSS